MHAMRKSSVVLDIFCVFIVMGSECDWALGKGTHFQLEGTWVHPNSHDLKFKPILKVTWVHPNSHDLKFKPILKVTWHTLVAVCYLPGSPQVHQELIVIMMWLPNLQDQKKISSFQVEHYIFQGWMARKCCWTVMGLLRAREQGESENWLEFGWRF